MRESVTVFFFANNNHLSNVKTLQSIYRQDYPYINLIVCNDCTYGFENERLLNNFDAARPANVQYVHFQENMIPMGEYASQAQFWDRINGEYYFIIHSGEYFIENTTLRSCINTLKMDKSLAAAVVGTQLWSDDFKQEISSTVICHNENHMELHSEDIDKLALRDIRDCMVVYQLSALRNCHLQIHDKFAAITQYALPQLLKEGFRVVALPKDLCRYSQSSIQDIVIPSPVKFGSDTLQNIKQLLQEKSEKQETADNLLFNASVQPPKPQKKSIHIFLYKMSSFAKIKSYAVLALLLYIAAALFMLLDASVLTLAGCIFLICAILATVLTVGMLVCNLYYKRNPQRLVVY